MGTYAWARKGVLVGSEIRIVIPGHGPPYRFGEVTEMFGVCFARRLAEAWPRMQGRPTTIRAKWFNFLHWLRWLHRNRMNPDITQPVFRHILTVTAIISGEELVLAEEEDLIAVCRYYESQLDGAANGREHAWSVIVGRMHHLVSVIRALGLQIGLPVIRLPRRSRVSSFRAAGAGGPCLAELTRSGRVDWSTPDNAVALLSRDARMDDNGLSFDRKMTAISSLNAVRLTALRKALETDLLKEYGRFIDSARILSLPGLPETADVVDKMENWAGDPRLKHWIRDVTGQNPEKALNLLLRWQLHGAVGGILPHFTSHPSYIDLEIPSAWIRTRVEAHSSIPITAVLQRLVSMGWRAWNAAFGILLIDTAWNVQPLLDLAADPFVGGSAIGRRTVTTTAVLASHKNRAGVTVDAVLGSSADACVSLSDVSAEGQTLSGIAVIRIVQEMTTILRASPGSGPLFLCTVNKESGLPAVVTVPDIGTQCLWWKRFLKYHAADPIIGGLPITRQMIRKTRLDIEAIGSAGDHCPSQLLANHTRSGTTMQRYLRTPWFRRELAEHIRRFQHLFEAAVASGIRDVACHLGIAEQDLVERKSVAMETGLGFVCLQPTHGIQPGTTIGERCDRLERCHQGCPARRFVPTEQGLISLVLTNLSLKAAMDVWIVRNPDRWQAVWMTLLAETEAYLERLFTSTHRLRLAATVDFVESALKNGELALIEPW